MGEDKERQLDLGFKLGIWSTISALPHVTPTPTLCFLVKRQWTYGAPPSPPLFVSFYFNFCLHFNFTPT